MIRLGATLKRKVNSELEQVIICGALTGACITSYRNCGVFESPPQA